MKKLYILLIVVFAILTAEAQDGIKCLAKIDTVYLNIDSLYYIKCNGTDQIMNNSVWERYRNLNMYIPDMDTSQPLHVPPIKTIRVNINIIQKDDGTCNFQNTYETRRRMRQILSYINEIYSGYGPSDPIEWVTELPNYDSRIRFSIGDTINERIYFYQNTDWWDDTIPDPIMTFIHSHYPDREEAVNIIIYGNPGDTLNYGFTTYPDNINFLNNHTVNTFYWRYEISDYAKANLLAHEMGHMLGVGHTYSDEFLSFTCDANQRDFLKDVFIVHLPDISNCPHDCCYYENAYTMNGDGITNNLMGGNQSSVYISPMQAGIMHRALSMYSSRKYVSCEKSNIPLIITEEEVWDFNMKLYQDLIIDSGAKVTITCHLTMHPDTKIIVKPGGKLIVDGATISNDIYDNNPWQGIEVWGNSSMHQQTVNGGYLQGYLQLKNGATIENAKCAVELWHPNHPNTAGGIIIATDAIFRNNAKSVHACNYTNYHPSTGREAPYRGSFKNCEFIIDNDYLGTELFFKHVDMECVNGIDFLGCDFSVLPTAGVSATCIGIGAYSAGFTVQSYCENLNITPCPTNLLKRCSFTGFNNGILSVNSGNSARSFSVKGSVFTNNHCGIYAQNTGFATIINNDFNIGCGQNCSYGIYADGVTGFGIEENLFTPVTETHCTTYGIGIGNSGSVNDIYRNTFQNLTCGNISYGVNYISGGGGFNNSIIHGLTYTCNDNIGNEIDFCVLKNNGSGGIRSSQGSATLPAGNRFSGSQYHFYNDGDHRIDYYYNLNGSDEIPYLTKLYCVTANSTSSANSCNSHYGGGNVTKSPEEKADLADTYKLSTDLYNNLKDVYDSQIAAGIIPKTELIAQIAEYAHERNVAAGDIIRSDLNDSIINMEELRQWLANMNDLASDRMIVASYIQNGNYLNAFALANTFPDIYNLEGNNLSDHTDYITLLNLYQSLYNSNRTVHNLTADETKIVTDIANFGFGTSQLMAKSILMEISNRDVDLYVCPDMPIDPDRSYYSNDVTIHERTTELIVDVAPIPATSWVTVSYNLPYDKTKATMKILNPFGIIVLETTLEGVKGDKKLNLNNIPSGVYSYIVDCDSYTKTGKLVITKK